MVITCNCCERELNATEKNFRRKRKTSTGYSYSCKLCDSDKNKIWRDSRFLRDPQGEHQKELNKNRRQRQERQTDPDKQALYVDQYTRWNEKVKKKKMMERERAPEFVRGGHTYMYVRDRNGWIPGLVPV